MCPQNFLVIGGGVGPAASVAFHQKIVDLTDNKGLGDQGHAPVIHLSMSPYILDRTKFLLDNADRLIPNPGLNMGLSVTRACQAFSDSAARFIVGVPCNTFHSQAVFDEYSRIAFHPRIHLVHMIRETATYLRENVKGGERIILLSTRGTRDTGVYDGCGELTKCSDNVDEEGKVDEYDKNLTYFLKDGDREADEEKIAGNQQGAVMAAIYDENLGIKGSTKNCLLAKKIFECVVKQLVRRVGGAPCHVIMGCTEIPLAYMEDPDAPRKAHKYIDPMNLLAKGMIEQGGYKLNAEKAISLGLITQPQVEEEDREPIVGLNPADKMRKEIELREKNKRHADDYTGSFIPLRSML